MVTVELPVFVTVTFCVVVFPMPTVPKLTVARLADSIPEPVVFAGVFALVKAVQLDSPALATMVASINAIAIGPTLLRRPY